VATILIIPPNFLISPEDFCDAFCVGGGAFGRPCSVRHLYKK